MADIVQTNAEDCKIDETEPHAVPSIDEYAHDTRLNASGPVVTNVGGNQSPEENAPRKILPSEPVCSLMDYDETEMPAAVSVSSKEPPSPGHVTRDRVEIATPPALVSEVFRPVTPPQTPGHAAPSKASLLPLEDVSAQGSQGSIVSSSNGTLVEEHEGDTDPIATMPGAFAVRGPGASVITDDAESRTSSVSILLAEPVDDEELRRQIYDDARDRILNEAVQAEPVFLQTETVSRRWMTTKKRRAFVASLVILLVTIGTIVGAVVSTQVDRNARSTPAPIPPSKENSNVPSQSPTENGNLPETSSGDSFVDVYPNCTVNNTDWIGDGVCDGQDYNTPECKWDGGDCNTFNDLYPNCDVDSPARVGDGVCNPDLDTEQCGRDGGDCLEVIDRYPNCTVENPTWIGDGQCDGNGTGYNTEQCGWDGGDCVVEGYPNCHVDSPAIIGDGLCNGGSSNTEECGWDDGDCVKFNELYPNCTASHPSSIGNGVCSDEYNTKECGWDGGDCANHLYPNCSVASFSRIGNDICDLRGGYNTEGCGWDGGDCTNFNALYPGCIVDWPDRVGDGLCDGQDYNTPECRWDGEDCVEFNKLYPNCTVPLPFRIGNGFCSRIDYNTQECGWDGGDCLEYNKLFPNCTATFPYRVGTGYCDVDYNIEACGYDGGDCCKETCKEVDYDVDWPQCEDPWGFCVDPNYGDRK